MSRLACHRVSAAYNGTTVLHAVDLEVAAGEWVAVIGPNGAGKTTLLRAVTGAVPADGGITVDGADLRAMARRERARAVATVPQSPVIPPDATVLEYVLLGRTPHLSFWRMEGSADVELVAGILDRLDLAPLAGRPMGRLSGGERQRAVLARALAQQPGVLLLDEPTTALDLGHSQQVLHLVNRLRHEDRIAVLAAMHDLTTAARYADRLVLLAAGRIVAAGPPAQVLTAELISEHYRAAVTVMHDPDGNPVVLPRG